MSQAVLLSEHAKRTRPGSAGYDSWLIGVAGILIGVGLVMVASSSIPIAQKYDHLPLYYFWRQTAAVILGLGFGFIVLQVPLSLLDRLSTVLLFASVALLAAILIPGVGREVNGSVRWIHLGPVSHQVS